MQFGLGDLLQRLNIEQRSFRHNNLDAMVPTTHEYPAYLASAGG